MPAHFIEEIFSAQIEYSFGIFQIVSEVAFNLICGKPEQRSIVGIKSDIFENIEAAENSIEADSCLSSNKEESKAAFALLDRRIELTQDTTHLIK